MKLLFVEDEKIILNGVVKHVPWEELEIDDLRAAHNAVEALELFEEFGPDIVLTDIRMPGIDGLAMCRRMREKKPNLQIILLTGFSNTEYLKSAIDLGVVGFLEKPVNQEDLRRMIRKAVKSCKKFSTEENERELSVRKKEKSAEEDEPEENEEKIHYTIKVVKEYIGEHYQEPELRVGEVADAVFLTPTYLSNLFKKQVGMTIGQYITSCRIEHAKKLLKDPRYKFYDISEIIGYNDANYFARAFRKSTGMTPSEWRKQH